MLSGYLIVWPRFSSLTTGIARLTISLTIYILGGVKSEENPIKTWIDTASIGFECAVARSAIYGIYGLYIKKELA